MENLVSMAREAADSAKAAFDAGETLTESQQQWLAYSNQLGSLDASVSGAKNALTSILLPVLGELASDGSAFLGDFTRDMNAAAGDTGAQTKVLTDYVVKGANLIKEKLPEYVAMGKEIVGGLLEGLGESAPELIEIAMDLVQYLFDGICEYAPQIAEAGIGLIQMLLESLISRGPDFVDSAAKMIADLVTGLAEAAPTLIPTAMQLIMQLVLALAENAPLLLEAGLELVLGIINGLVAGLSDFESSASDIVNALITGFTEAGPKILAIGGDIVRGIWDGISQGTEWILGKIETWVGSVLDWIKEKLGIHSPSAVMRDQVGIWMARGIGQGFVDEMSKINKMMADSIDTSFDLPEFRYGARRYSGRNYVTGSGKTVNLYITAKSIAESDISMLLDLVNRKLGESM
jgi:hypothetical protein